MKDNESICLECGLDMPYPEGWHYCPICDTETYFEGVND